MGEFKLGDIVRVKLDGTIGEIAEVMDSRHYGLHNSPYGIYFGSTELELVTLTPELGRRRLAQSGKLDDYQQTAAQLAIYPDQGNCLLYPLLGLIDEAGELIAAAWNVIETEHDGTPVSLVLELLTYAGKLAGHLKKSHRDDSGTLRVEARLALECLLFHIQEAAGELEEQLPKVETLPLPPVSWHEPPTPEKLHREAGDVLWYLAQTCTELGVPLSQVALENVDKLLDRKARGKLSGSGDNR